MIVAYMEASCAAPLSQHANMGLCLVDVNWSWRDRRRSCKGIWITVRGHDQCGAFAVVATSENNPLNKLVILQ